MIGRLRIKPHALTLLWHFPDALFSLVSKSHQEDSNMATKRNHKTAREQGFPEPYLGPAGNFRPGYDATAKRDLIAAVLGLPNPNRLHRFTKAKPQRLIAARGWQGFLVRKREGSTR